MPKRVLQGVVVSDKQNKTVVVSVERRYTHPIFKKTIRRSKKFHAHDENNTHKTGDVVSIEEHRPLSKNKRWIVVGTPSPDAAPKSGQKAAPAEKPAKAAKAKK